MALAAFKRAGHRTVGSFPFVAEREKSSLECLSNPRGGRRAPPDHAFSEAEADGEGNGGIPPPSPQDDVQQMTRNNTAGTRGCKAAPLSDVEEGLAGFFTHPAVPMKPS